MFSIGEFASYGRVSVRMLRHYDSIGLLPPAAVDGATGYRSYEARQLSQLNRIVALKDLGFTLEQVRSVLDAAVSAEELRGMLRLRQEELRAQLATDTSRLAQVAARLQIIEKEGSMPAVEVQIRPIPAVRVVELTDTAASFEPASIAPVISPLYSELIRRLERAGATPAGPPLAYYEACSGSDRVVVHACFPVHGADVHGEDYARHALDVVDLPRIVLAATTVHCGSMDDVMATLQLLAYWMDAHGYRSLGLNRELYLQCDGPRDTWVTELQEPVVAGWGE